MDDNTALNDPAELGEIINYIISMISDVVGVFRRIYIFENVSLFDFLICVAVMGIVIVYLLNVARRPGIESISSERARKYRSFVDDEVKQARLYRERLERMDRESK